MSFLKKEHYMGLISQKTETEVSVVLLFIYYM